MNPDGGAQPFTVPDKFMVKGADEQPDYKAIVEKMGQSYNHLEKRLGTGDVPPKTADEYKLDKYLPDGFDAKPEAVKPILEKFHKAGLTNAQLQVVMGTFGEQLSAGLAAEKAGHAQATEALKKTWGESFGQNMGAANTALAAYTADDPELKAQFSDPKLANNPAIIRLLAKVGADLGEDRPAGGLDGATAESIDEIRKSKAYTDSKDPGHAEAVRKVTEAYAKGYKANRE
ncbi:hypothetical protein F6V25_07960 [Oryzomonas japonica]|uniref:Uncharacterized protein n=1 Tax=Oryzomonas japonica TaxID=2603858 RepID=A0A7J4ZRR6_9BACT|nr:hypothetical protein F6V25_07960 [Oryzomonas japonica]